MRRRFIFLVVFVWLFFTLGLILHTSRNPLIFNKYSLKYFIGLLIIFISIFPGLKLTNFLFSTSNYRFKKKKYKFAFKQKNLIFLLIIILVFFSSELFLRYIYKNFESGSYKFTIDSFHPFLQSKLSTQDNIGINSLGFRNSEIKTKKPEGTYRIVILGGSTVLNREVSYEKNSARVLEKLLQKEYENKKIEVINAGKDGYNSEHSIIQYLFDIKDLDPDLVIMWHGINDLLSSCVSPNTDKLKFKRDYSHILGPLEGMVLEHFKLQPLIRFKSVTLDMLVKNLKDNLYSDVVLYLNIIQYSNLASSYLKGGSNYANISDFPSIAVYKRNITSFIDILSKDNVPFILGNQASLYKKQNSLDEVKKIIFPNLYCKKDEKFYSLESIKLGMKKINEETKEIALVNNIEFIDFDSKIPKNTDYFFDSIHYTEKGNEIIALLLFNKIKDSGLIQ